MSDYTEAARAIAQRFAGDPKNNIRAQPLDPREYGQFVAAYGERGVSAVKNMAALMGVEKTRLMALDHH